VIIGLQFPQRHNVLKYRVAKKILNLNALVFKKIFGDVFCTAFPDFFPSRERDTLSSHL